MQRWQSESESVHFGEKKKKKKEKADSFLGDVVLNVTWEVCTLGPRGDYLKVIDYRVNVFLLWSQTQRKLVQLQWSEAYIAGPPGWQCDSTSNNTLSLALSVSLPHTDHPWEIIWAEDRTAHPATPLRPAVRTSRTTTLTAPPNPPAGCATPKLTLLPPWTTTTSSPWRSSPTSNPSPGRSLWILTSALPPQPPTFPSSPCADRDVVRGRALGLWQGAVCPGPKTERGALATRCRWRSGARRLWRSRRRATTRRWRRRRGRCSTWRASEPASTTSQIAPPRARRSRKRPWETKTQIYITST